MLLNQQNTQIMVKNNNFSLPVAKNRKVTARCSFAGIALHITVLFLELLGIPYVEYLLDLPCSYKKIIWTAVDLQSSTLSIVYCRHLMCFFAQPNFAPSYAVYVPISSFASSKLLLQPQLFAFANVLVLFWQTRNNNEMTKRIILPSPQ